MIAGPNGSGKSTLIAQLLAQGADLGEHLNADVIAKSLGPPSEDVSRRAQAIVRDRREELLLANRDYSWETVMSHPSHIEHLLAARRAGYRTSLLFVATEDPRVNLGRIAERVEVGGHDVPGDRVMDRWVKSIGLLPRALLTAHRARVFDNGNADRPFQLVATLDDEVFETAAPVERLPIWFRPTIAEMYRHQA